MNDDYLVSELRKYNVSAGFKITDYEAFKEKPQLLEKVARTLLEQNFPSSLHEDILQSVGLELSVNHLVRRSRASDFRDRILKAYEQKCAVCSFDVRMGNATVGLEAAHIKWHQAHGPDTEENGLALCALHHKLFDRGVFTLDENCVILVSELACGSKRFDDWLMQFHSKRINNPVRLTYKPDINFIHWHNKEVFQGQAREVI
jgi:putative restriction endonuclease